MIVYGLKCLVDQEIAGRMHKAGAIVQVHMMQEVLNQQLPHSIPGATERPKTLAVVEMEAVEIT